VYTSHNKYSNDKTKEIQSTHMNYQDEYRSKPKYFRDEEKQKWIGKNFQSLVLNHKGLYNL